MTKHILPCVHAVMVLLESAQSEGMPTAEQIQAAIFGDRETRSLTDVYSNSELKQIVDGGNKAVEKAAEIHAQAEFYRLELGRVMRMFHQQYDRYTTEINDMMVRSVELDKRIEELERQILLSKENL